MTISERDHQYRAIEREIDDFKAKVARLTGDQNPTFKVYEIQFAAGRRFSISYEHPYQEGAIRQVCAEVLDQMFAHSPDHQVIRDVLDMLFSHLTKDMLAILQDDGGLTREEADREVANRCRPVGFHSLMEAEMRRFAAEIDEDMKAREKAIKYAPEWQRFQTNNWKINL